MSHLTHSNAIVSVCIDLHAVVFARSEHCIPLICYTTVLDMHILAVIITVSGSAISDACLVYYCQLWLDCVTTKGFLSAYHFLVQWLQLCLLSSDHECAIDCKCACLCHSPLYDMLSSCFAAGALACFEVSQIRTIYQAVVDENWGTAIELLGAVSEGKLSGSA